MSGLHIERLSSEALQVEILPDVGGRIHRMRAFGHDLLRTPADVAMQVSDPFFWGCFPLVPWSNRVPGGRIEFQGRVVDVPCNLGPDAIHGEASARPWSVEGDGLLAFQGGRYGFPWPYDATMQYAVNGASLTLALSIVNTGHEAMPAGLGIHPWFFAGSGLEASIPADLSYPLTNMLPGGPPQPVAGVLDRRALTRVPWGLDNLWTGLTAYQIVLRWPDLGLRAAYSFTEAATHIVAASVEQNDAVAIEPVTHATDGFRLLAEGKPGGISVLQPGATLAVTYMLTVTPA